MKKIFAIALALVMVLSMASAFATTCPTINWACDTYTCATGKGSVEVIPYVKGNACGGDGVAFTPNTCAGAVNTEEVYFAVKVTVEANPSADWWKEAVLTMSTKGLETVYVGTVDCDATVTGLDTLLKNEDAKGQDDIIAGEYYLTVEGNSYAFVKAADFEATAASLFKAEVDNATTAKVCAKLTSEADLADEFEIAGYKVKYVKGKAGTTTATFEITKGDKKVAVLLDADEKISEFWTSIGTKAGIQVKTYSPDKSAFWNEGENKALRWTCTDEGAFLKAVMDAFKFEFGTCITDAAVKANFAWDDKVESCFSWSDKVQAVVDAECVVAIPKTGDASVLAWLF